MERPAAGTECFLIRGFDPVSGEGELFIRVYGAAGDFKDYRIDSDEIEIQIMDSFVSFYDGDTGGDYDGTIDYDSKTIGGDSDNGKSGH